MQNPNANGRYWIVETDGKEFVVPVENDGQVPSPAFTALLANALVVNPGMSGANAVLRVRTESHMDGAFSHRASQFEAAPAVPTGDGGVWVPKLLEFAQLFGFRNLSFAIKLFDGRAHTEIVARKNIQASEAKDQKHLCCPEANSFHLHQFSNNRFIRKQRKFG